MIFFFHKISKKNISGIILFFCLLFLSAGALPASAQRWSMPDPQIKIPGMEKFTEPISKLDHLGNEYYEINWLSVYIASLYKLAVNIVGLLSVVVMMWGGLLWLTAGGNTGRIENAKGWIGAAATGLVLTLASYTILYQINPDLIKMPTLRIGAAKGDIEPSQIRSQMASGGGERGSMSLSANIATYDQLLIENAEKHQTDCTLMKAIMIAESSGRPEVISSAGAVGLMQLMPATANLNEAQLKDPATNIDAGAKYLAYLQTRACNGGRVELFHMHSVCTVSDIKYIIAAYNGGPGANKPSQEDSCYALTFWQCPINKGYEQTRQYVERVQGFQKQLLANNWGC